MRNFKRIAIVIFLGVSMAATGQHTKEFKRIFLDAEYLYAAGFYEEAYNRYKNMLTLDPGNCNILFRCGACCLNIPGNEQQAVTYLKEAAKGVTQEYKEGSHKESGAPVLTYYMLGRAYHTNNQFDLAVDNYNLYREIGRDEEPLQLEYAGLQIEASHRAEGVVKESPSFEFQSVLDHFEEDLPSCNNPVVSGDGNILIFLVDYPSDKKIMMTRREGGVWTRPKVINTELGMVGENYPVCLSYDGRDLYLVHQFYSHSDIFVSSFKNNRWSEAEALGHNVNGRTSETHASISKDGKILYFTSDARGGQGSFDIYISRLDDRGEWGVPENMGPVINTPYEEQSPFISSNDSILFFSSQGHATIGGFDVFYAELGPGGIWKEPKSLGYPVNTTGEDLFFNPGWDELDSYYAVRREDDPTSNTINMVIELEPEEQEAAVEEAVSVSLIEPETQVEAGIEPETQVEAGIEPETQVEAVIEPETQVEAVIEPVETDEIHEALNKQSVEEIATIQPLPAPAAGSTRLHTSVPFDHNVYELCMAAMLEVEKVADVMQSYPETHVKLTGHADATGTPEYNLLLSNQRASQIAHYLEMRGIDSERIILEGKGEATPVARNMYPDGTDAPLGRYLNRQVTVTITSPVPIQANLSGSYVPASLKPEPGEVSSEEATFWFTIQVHASLHPLEISNFQELSGVEEYACTDGYYRYTSGSYRTFPEARDALRRIHDAGYPDAYIQTIEYYHKVSAK